MKADTENLHTLHTRWDPFCSKCRKEFRAMYTISVFEELLPELDKILAQ